MSIARCCRLGGALAGLSWLILGSPRIAVAQNEQDDDTRPVQPLCDVTDTGTSRGRRPCRDLPSRSVVSFEHDVPIALEAPLTKPGSCLATVAIDYTQRVTLASVEGTVENPDCSASSGSFKVLVTLREAAGDVRTLEFTERWSRDDDRPVPFKADYPIGEDVDLLRVRPRSLSCSCGGEANQE